MLFSLLHPTFELKSVRILIWSNLFLHRNSNVEFTEFPSDFFWRLLRQWLPLTKNQLGWFILFSVLLQEILESCFLFRGMLAATNASHWSALNSLFLP